MCPSCWCVRSEVCKAYISLIICAPPARIADCLQVLRNMPDAPQLPAATLALCHVPFTAFLFS